MELSYTSCRVTCHRCRHEWTYMGSRLSSFARSVRPVKISCPQCQCRVAMEVQHAV